MANVLGLYKANKLGCARRPVHSTVIRLIYKAFTWVGGSGVQRGVRGCDDPGHPAWGHPTREFLKRNVVKYLKIREVKATATGIQDKEASEIIFSFFRNKRKIEIKVKKLGEKTKKGRSN